MNLTKNEAVCLYVKHTIQTYEFAAFKNLKDSCALLIMDSSEALIQTLGS